MNRSAPWTPADDARLAGMWADGDAAAEIGKRLGRGRDAVLWRARVLKLPLRKSGRPRGGRWGECFTLDTHNLDIEYILPPAVGQEQPQTWDCQTRRLWSLWDMIELGLIAQSVALGSSLRFQARMYRDLGPLALPPIGQRVTTPSGIVLERETMASNIATTTSACKKWGLQSSMMAAFDLENWILSSVLPGTFLELAGRMDGLICAVMSEATFRLFLIIPHELSRYVNQEQPLGAAVYDAFPSARSDLTEAGNCLALGRHTASVFHLMRTMEIGLGAARKCLAIPDPVTDADRNWGAVLRKFKTEMDSRNAATPKQWKNASDKDFFAEAYALLDAVRNVWRNATMHVEIKYVEEDADIIFRAVRAFMKKLASRLDEQGQPLA